MLTIELDQVLTRTQALIKIRDTLERECNISFLFFDYIRIEWMSWRGIPFGSDEIRKLVATHPFLSRYYDGHLTYQTAHFLEHLTKYKEQGDETIVAIFEKVEDELNELLDIYEFRQSRHFFGFFNLLETLHIRLFMLDLTLHAVRLPENISIINHHMCPDFIGFFEPFQDIFTWSACNQEVSHLIEHADFSETVFREMLSRLDQAREEPLFSKLWEWFRDEALHSLLKKYYFHDILDMYHRIIEVASQRFPDSLLLANVQLHAAEIFAIFNESSTSFDLSEKATRIYQSKFRQVHNVQKALELQLAVLPAQTQLNQSYHLFVKWFRSDANIKNKQFESFATFNELRVLDLRSISIRLKNTLASFSRFVLQHYEQEYAESMIRAALEQDIVLDEFSTFRNYFLIHLFAESFRRYFDQKPGGDKTIEEMKGLMNREIEKTQQYLSKASSSAKHFIRIVDSQYVSSIRLRDLEPFLESMINHSQLMLAKEPHQLHDWIRFQIKLIQIPKYIHFADIKDGSMFLQSLYWQSDRLQLIENETRVILLKRILDLGKYYKKKIYIFEIPDLAFYYSELERTMTILHEQDSAQWIQSFANYIDIIEQFQSEEQFLSNLERNYQKAQIIQDMSKSSIETLKKKYYEVLLKNQGMQVVQKLWHDEYANEVKNSGEDSPQSLTLLLECASFYHDLMLTKKRHKNREDTSHFDKYLLYAVGWRLKQSTADLSAFDDAMLRKVVMVFFKSKFKEDWEIGWELYERYNHSEQVEEPLKLSTEDKQTVFDRAGKLGMWDRLSEIYEKLFVAIQGEYRRWKKSDDLEFLVARLIKAATFAIRGSDERVRILSLMQRCIEMLGSEHPLSLKLKTKM